MNKWYPNMQKWLSIMLQGQCQFLKEILKEILLTIRYIWKDNGLVT